MWYKLARKYLKMQLRARREGGEKKREKEGRGREEGEGRRRGEKMRE